MPRLVPEADLDAIAGVAIDSPTDLPEPVWDATELTDPETGRHRPPSDAATERIEDWITTWSHTRAANTTQAYRTTLRAYWRWAEGHTRDPFTILALRDYLYGLAHPRIRYLQALRTRRRKRLPRGHEPGLSWNSLCQAHAAIARAWAMNGMEVPSSYGPWQEWWQGVHRHLAAPVDQKDPLLLRDLTAALDLVDASTDGLTTLRDRALLLLGWHAALRISELAALDVGDVHQGPAGWLVHIAASKTDQLGKGADKPLYATTNVDLDPIAAYHAWVQGTGLGTGPLFRSVTKHGTLRQTRLSVNGIRTVLSRYINLKNWGAHSMRIGYITEARLAGASTEQIMQVSHHKRREMVDHYAAQVDAHHQGPGALG